MLLMVDVDVLVVLVVLAVVLAVLVVRGLASRIVRLMLVRWNE